MSGEAVSARTPAQFLEAARDQPAHSPLLINCDPRTTYALCSALRRRPDPAIIALDLVLRRPGHLLAHLHLLRKRRLLNRVDCFIHYFRDLRGLDRYFGICPDRSLFVPFKANLVPPARLPENDGKYVLCFGRSLRDFDTFFAAVDRLPYPAAIAEPNLAELRAHGARFERPLSQLPANLSLLPDDDTPASQIRILSGARIVVLPILPSNLVASGISTCLNAMLYGRCVILTDGPGASDVFGTDQLFTVPPADPAALAQCIRRVWEDDSLRRQTALAGFRFASALGGEPELYQRVVDNLAAWYVSSRRIT